MAVRVAIRGGGQIVRYLPKLSHDNVVLTTKNHAWVDELRSKLKADPMTDPFAGDFRRRIR